MPHPLSACLVDVIGLVSHEVSAILTEDTTSLNSPLLNDRNELLRSSECNAIENIAHLFSLSILNASCNCIRNKGHEVTDWEILPSSKDAVNVVLVILGQVARNGLLNVGICCLHNSWAARTASGSSNVQIIIVHGIVLNGMDDT